MPSVPTNVYRKNLESDSVEIQWGPPNSPRGVLKEYTLQLKNLNTGAFSVVTVDVDKYASTQVHKFTELDGETEYRVQVSALVIVRKVLSMERFKIIFRNFL